MPWIPLFCVLAILVVQSSCFALGYPSHIIYSNYQPVSLLLCWISGTCEFSHLGVYVFFVRRIFIWWRTRYFVNGWIIS
jgi:hypothetical protein